MTKDNNYKIYTGDDLIKLPTEEEKYLIDGLLWEGDHAFILGKEKSGKSIFTLQMACSLTCGQAFMNTYEVPEACTVLYVQTEGKIRDTVERIKAMTNEQGVDWDPNNFYLLYYHSLALDTVEGFNHFNQLIRHVDKPKVIILDPLYMSMVGDLIDNTAARHMVRNLRKINEMYDSTIIIVHHENKPRRDTGGSMMVREGSETIFGSFVWSAFADHIIAIKRNPDNSYKLSCDTQRTSRVIQNVDMLMIQPYPLYYEIVGTDQKPYVQEVLHILEKVDPTEGITRQELVDKSTHKMSAIEKSLNILVKEGKAKRLNPGKRPIKYIPCGQTL